MRKLAVVVVVWGLLGNILNAQAPVQAQDVLPSQAIELELQAIQQQIGQVQAAIAELRKQNDVDHATIMGDTHSLAQTAKAVSLFAVKYVVPGVVAFLAGHKMR